MWCKQHLTQRTFKLLFRKQSRRWLANQTSSHLVNCERNYAKMQHWPNQIWAEDNMAIWLSQWWKKNALCWQEQLLPFPTDNSKQKGVAAQQALFGQRFVGCGDAKPRLSACARAAISRWIWRLFQLLSSDGCNLRRGQCFLDGWIGWCKFGLLQLHHTKQRVESKPEKKYQETLILMNFNNL